MIVDVPRGPARALLSYFYFPKMVELPDHIDVMVDSGGFQAWSRGKTIDIAEYARWAKALTPAPHAFCNLDVIRDPEATWDNQRRLEDELGLAVLPIYHFGEPLDWLYRYLEAGYDYIMLGGMVGKPSTSLLRFAADCFVRAGHTGVVFHGLGISSNRLLGNLPWYSVDSSTWTASSRFGQLTVFDPRRKVLRTLYNHNRSGRGSGDTMYDGLADVLRARGFDLEKFNHGNYHHRDVRAVSIDSFQRFETWCRQRHGVVTRKSTGTDGLRLYLVADQDGLVHFPRRFDDHLRRPAPDERVDPAAAEAG